MEGGKIDYYFGMDGTIKKKPVSFITAAKSNYSNYDQNRDNTIENDSIMKIK